MLPLLFVLIFYLFLLAVAVVFLICAAIPFTRRFALSASLWIALWGPSSILLMTIAGLALAADAFITKGPNPALLQNPHLLSVFGWTYLASGALITSVVASTFCWLHQFLIHRITFALFRLYATAVVAGIGSVFGWAFSWWLLSRGIAYAPVWSLLAMVLLVAGFSVAAYKNTDKLRGKAPNRLTWITEEEFFPTSTSIPRS